ncbi:MAG: TolC family protein [Oceanicoccus sp.]
MKFLLLSAAVYLGLSSNLFAGDEGVKLANVSSEVRQSATGVSNRSTTPSTTLSRLLESVELHAPQIILARAPVDIAEANELVASSGFDPVLSAKYSNRLSGFYDGQVADVNVTQRLNGLNADVYGGYSVSNGDLPVYEDQFLTNSGGEFRAGARFALMRGREIDPERTKLATARLGTEQATNAAEADVISIKASAVAAFVDWLYVERILAVYQELYSIAETRIIAIEKAIAAGQLASITRDENQQLLLARRSQLLKSEQDTLEARARLSLFLRDQNGQPQAPILGESSGVPQNDPYLTASVEELLRQVLDDRPDLTALRFELQALTAKERLADNDLQPELDFIYEVSRDVGNGLDRRSGTDHKVGLEFKLPLAFARARGEGAALRARANALKAEIRLREDRTALALGANQQGLIATEQQVQVGSSEIKIAETLSAAEERRYLAGTSDIFRLNAQETALANSQFRLLRAQRDHDTLLNEFYRITGQFWF